ncbi:TorD/DmsD family molecular chaperone [Noviherbaspirillum galbum]|uniref:Molecular chaperone n=1 Tax=Noviherbaspirillum galbum TaxID=2709383 RepID=A0A6B3SRD0_9BURK|nr:molecular chaperone TorD family protein [Noviherbaspirillum galbum]NEX63201.1 molecular chaperone [Noviherbaspirillum galbum]
MTSTQTLRFEAPDQGEETARADLYGLLASLFYAPASKDLIDRIAASGQDGDGVLEQAWSGLVDACKRASADEVRDEYESLFIGVGKPDVMLYGSYYLSGFLMEKPLAALRDDLGKLGLQRDEAVPESEDHIATLCEVMRYLIASDDSLHANVATQKNFFATHIQPWADTMCEAVIQHPAARFHASVARLASAFFAVEAQAFDMA